MTLAPGTFQYINSGIVDPRNPLVIPARPDVNSIYVQLTPNRKMIVMVWYWNRKIQNYTR